MTQKIYLVTSWDGQTLNRNFGVFSSKAAILPLFQKFFNVLPNLIFNRNLNPTKFNIIIQELVLDDIIWFDCNSIGQVVFETLNKTQLQIQQFCQN